MLLIIFDLQIHRSSIFCFGLYKMIDIDEDILYIDSFFFFILFYIFILSVLLNGIAAEWKLKRSGG